MNLDEIILALDLCSHPEGGYYRRTHNVPSAHGTRGLMSSIYYLLPGGIFNSWHKMDADEMWIWNAGSPLELASRETPQSPTETLLLGPDIPAGQKPQQLIPANYWQGARSTGNWTLVTCIVSPEFLFIKHDMAEGDWDTGPLNIPAEIL